jgi:hypothetical protein
VMLVALASLVAAMMRRERGRIALAWRDAGMAKGAVR